MLTTVNYQGVFSLQYIKTTVNLIFFYHKLFFPAGCPVLRCPFCWRGYIIAKNDNQCLSCHCKWGLWTFLSVPIDYVIYFNLLSNYVHVYYSRLDLDLLTRMFFLRCHLYGFFCVCVLVSYRFIAVKLLKNTIFNDVIIYLFSFVSNEIVSWEQSLSLFFVFTISDELASNL